MTGTAMSGDDTHQPRDYGGWRRRRGIGLFGLGGVGTLAVLTVLLALIITATADAALLLYVAPPVLAAGGLGLARIGGDPLALAVVRRVRWWHGSARNYTQYRAAVVAERAPAFWMPGVLAPLTLLDAEDGSGGRYGIVLDRRTGLMTPTLRVIPACMWLADRQDADAWVANWGGWLASLGFLPAVRWVTVTVDTAPEPGSTLADAVAAALDPASPLAARQIMGQLVQAAPAAAVDIDTRVSITFDPKASPAAPVDLIAAAAEVGRAMHGLESALDTCGVSVLGRASAAEIAGVIRTAFDPAARGEVNRILVQSTNLRPGWQLGWDDAGPVGAEEEPGCYRHDSGISVTWGWQEAPRQNVTADVLARLVAPAATPSGSACNTVHSPPPRPPEFSTPRSTPPSSGLSTSAVPGGTRPRGTATTRPAPGRPPPRKQPVPGCAWCPCTSRSPWPARPTCPGPSPRPRPPPTPPGSGCAR